MSMNLQKTIMDLRREKGYTQEKLAEMLGVTTAAVSKWECGNSYPDITLLPQIAEIFDVSLDYLFDYNTATHKTISDVIEEANRFAKEHNRDGAITLIAKTLARYPGNVELIFELARHRLLGARNKSKKERQAMMQDAENGFHIVAENTKNDTQRTWAYHFMTTIAMLQKDYEKARSYNDHIVGGRGLYPKTDRAIIELREYDNADALHYAKEVMCESIIEYSLIIIWVVNYHLLHDEVDEAIWESQRAISVLEEFEETGLFDNDLSVLWEGLAWAYAKKNDFENVLIGLERACDYAIQHDFAGNSIIYNVYGILKSSMESEERISTRTNLLNTLESSERQEYTPLQNHPRFKKTIEKLHESLSTKEIF